MSQEGFNVNDLVICDKGGGKLVGGGFELNSGMLGHSSPVVTDSGNNQKGGSAIVSSLKGLAVPAGLLYLQKSMQDHYYEFDNKDAVVDESLYDKLYAMASNDDDVSSNSSSNSSNKSKKKRKPTTRRKKDKSNRKGTRRRRTK